MLVESVNLCMQLPFFARIFSHSICSGSTLDFACLKNVFKKIIFIRENTKPDNTAILFVWKTQSFSCTFLWVLSKFSHMQTFGKFATSCQHHHHQHKDKYTPTTYTQPEMYITVVLKVGPHGPWSITRGSVTFFSPSMLLYLGVQARTSTQT